MPPSLADILGPWRQPDFESGLIARCREAWSTPLDSPTNHERVTCLEQGLALEHVLPLAKERLRRNFDDDTELFDGHLAEAVAAAEKV